MAAEAIVRAGGDPSRAAREYEALLSEDLLREIRVARLLTAILNLAPPLSFRLFSLESGA